MKVLKPFMIALALASFTGTGLATEQALHKGTVTYVKTTGGYSYIKIKEAGKEVWIAALPMQVAVGEEIEYMGGDVMSKFHSKAMDMTFDSIRFVSRVHVVGKDEPKAMPKDDVHKAVGAGKAVATPVKPGEIVKPRQGKTVGELFTQSGKLSGTQVVLRAKVIKLSKNILGKNWVTLSDGTGTPPNDKIIATTMDTPAIGEILTATGVLRTNVNVGAGYQYAVMLEDTKFSK